jgi:hypothetical protein
MEDGKVKTPPEGPSLDITGKEGTGRPNGTWRRTVDQEREILNKPWHELKWGGTRQGWLAGVDSWRMGKVKSP